MRPLQPKHCPPCSADIAVVVVAGLRLQVLKFSAKPPLYGPKTFDGIMDIMFAIVVLHNVAGFVMLSNAGGGADADDPLPDPFADSSCAPPGPQPKSSPPSPPCSPSSGLCAAFDSISEEHHDEEWQGLVRVTWGDHILGTMHARAYTIPPVAMFLLIVGDCSHHSPTALVGFSSLSSH